MDHVRLPGQIDIVELLIYIGMRFKAWLGEVGYTGEMPIYSASYPDNIYSIEGTETTAITNDSPQHKVPMIIAYAVRYRSPATMSEQPFHSRKKQWNFRMAGEFKTENGDVYIVKQRMLDNLVEFTIVARNGVEADWLVQLFETFMDLNQSYFMAAGLNKMAFYARTKEQDDITDNMDLAEDFIKYCVQWALDNCYDDVKFLNDMFDKGLIERLQGVLKEEFVRLPYTEGIKILEEAVVKGHKFEFPVYWGVDLASEHERYLVEEHFKRPVILTDYPKEIKAFYMKQNEDGKTVRAMDVLFPKIGEIIGGSEREADYDKLMTRIQELGIPMKDMWWYLDTRKFGSCPHSGFGLGFERLLLFVTGMTNIRDVIPFPRTPRNAEF
jgi:hypothetical protein